jgi:hypothetical protein
VIYPGVSRFLQEDAGERIAWQFKAFRPQP